MRTGSHLEVLTAEAEDLHLSLEDISPDTQALRSRAAELSSNLAWVPNHRQSSAFRDRSQTLARRFKPLLAALRAQPRRPEPGDFRLLQESAFLLAAELQDVFGTFNLPTDL